MLHLLLLLLLVACAAQNVTVVFQEAGNDVKIYVSGSLTELPIGGEPLESPVLIPSRFSSTPLSWSVHNGVESTVLNYALQTGAASNSCSFSPPNNILVSRTIEDNTLPTFGFTIATLTVSPNYTPGDDLSGTGLIPGASLDGLGLGIQVCELEFTGNTNSVQRIQIIAELQPPSPAPTTIPTQFPSLSPTVSPTLFPTLEPTESPSTYFPTTAQPTTAMPTFVVTDESEPVITNAVTFLLELFDRGVAAFLDFFDRFLAAFGIDFVL